MPKSEQWHNVPHPTICNYIIVTVNKFKLNEYYIPCTPNCASTCAFEFKRISATSVQPFLAAQ